MNLLSRWLRELLLLPPAASSMAADIDDLHFLVILSTFAGVSALVLVAGFFCIRYRQRGPRGSSTRRAPGPTAPLWFELGVAVGLFALFTAFWVVGFSQYVSLARAPAGALDVYVTGKQWMWKFAYPDGTTSVDDLYVPVDRPVRLILTSRDVIHSFYVPAFRLKQDAVPGRYTSLWFSANAPGHYPVFCAEYCGTEHSRMRGTVVALAQDDFAHWLERAGEREGGSKGAPVVASLSSEGERVAARYGCLRCHTVDGSPHIGPTFAGMYGADVPLRGGGRALADVPYLTESMMDPAVKIHEGFEPVMPSYQGYLAPPEVSALVEYIKALKNVPSQGVLERSDSAQVGAVSAPLPRDGGAP